MKAMKTFSVLAIAGLAVTGCGGDDTYPSSSIEFVIPYDAGGGADPVGRELSKYLQEDFGETVNVINRPGGDEVIGLNSVANADPDGHTLGLGTWGGITVAPMINDQTNYEGPESFSPIIRISGSPYGLLVAGDSEFENLEDLVAYAEENPGSLSVGTAARYSSTTLVALAIEDALGVEMRMIPSSSGSGETALSVMSGELDAMVVNAAGQAGLVESGDLKTMALTGDGIGIFEGEDTFAEYGYDLDFASQYFAIAPSDVSEEVEEALIEASVAALETDEWAEFAESQGNDVNPIAGEELTEFMLEEREIYSELVSLAEDRF